MEKRAGKIFGPFRGGSGGSKTGGTVGSIRNGAQFNAQKTCCVRVPKSDGQKGTDYQNESVYFIRKTVGK